MNYSIKLIDHKTLCIFNSNNKPLATYKPRWTEFKEFRRVGLDRIIVRESDDMFSDNTGHANIYCLDDDFQIIWTIIAPFKNDNFPNAIVWDKQTVRRQNDNGYLTLDAVDNKNTFMCSSWHGITVTVDYKTGQIISSELTK
jgi:hypothetical protein